MLSTVDYGCHAGCKATGLPAVSQLKRDVRLLKEGKNLMTNSEQYPRFDGVLMKPGVRVYCHDRDDPHYDLEGTITEVIKEQGDWSFKVAFDGPPGEPSNRPLIMSWYAVSPTFEESRSEAALQYKAEKSLRVFLCHASENKPDILKKTGYRILFGQGREHS